MIKCFEWSTGKRIQGNSNNSSRYYLYSIVNKRWVWTWQNDLNKILNKWKRRHYTRMGIQQSLMSPWKGSTKKKKKKKKSCYNTGCRYLYLVTPPNRLNFVERRRCPAFFLNKIHHYELLLNRTQKKIWSFSY